MNRSGAAGVVGALTAREGVGDGDSTWGSSNPAAMTVTRTSSPSASSMTAPKMMFASGCAASGRRACGLVDLEDAEVGSALDRQQHAVGAVDAGFEQRRGDRQLGCLDRAVGAACRSDAHESRARALHDRLDVGEVEVDQPGGGDQVGDALHTRQQHLVGGLEGVEHADLPVADLQEAVVRDDDERVDFFLSVATPASAWAGAPLAFEAERAW